MNTTELGSNRISGCPIELQPRFENEERERAVKAKSQVKSELGRLEVDLKNLVEGSEETMGKKTIWLEQTKS